MIKIINEQTGKAYFCKTKYDNVSPEELLKMTDDERRELYQHHRKNKNVMDKKQ